MEGREAMAFPGAHPPFYFPRGAFTSQSASALHAPPGLRPMSNPDLQHTLSNSGHPFPLGDQDFSHGIHMGIAASSPDPSPPATEPEVKKKRGRPRKYVPDGDGDVALELSHTPSSSQNLKSSDPNAPKRPRGRPPGTGRKQRLANLGEWMNTSAGLAFAPHVISVEAGEDIVSKVHSFSQQRPRALCIMSGCGKFSSVTLREPADSVPSLSYYTGPYEIISLGGSYLVNEEAGPKSRTGGISVSFTHNGCVTGGRVVTLIAASLVQVVACSFVYGSAKAKAIKQENGSKEDKETHAVEPAAESEADAAQTPPDFLAPAMSTGWSGSGGGGGGGGRSIDSRNNNHFTDIDLTRG